VPGSRYFSLFFLLLPLTALGERFTGRFAFGGYSSTERFSNDSATGSNKNDFQTLSFRLFLKDEGIGDSNWENTLDLRDKHDFFDKLDREKLSLTAKNEFQFRQFSFKNSPQNRFWGTQIGRFPIPEAGAAFVDGAQVQNHWSKSWNSSFFGGYNPKKEGQSYLESDPKAQIAGATLTYEMQGLGWTQNFYSTQAYVTELYGEHTDRKYIFQNLIYQWNELSRITTLLYYDMVPRSYLQNGFASWQQGWGPIFTSEFSYTNIDVIEYSRRQDVLEKLPSSAYHEDDVKLTLNDLPNHFYLHFVDGEREVDKLTTQTAEIGFILSQLWGRKWDLYLVGGKRKNFTSHDTIGRFGIGYFSRTWEFNLDSRYAIEKDDDGTTTHPLTIEGSLAYYFSRSLYMVVSAESASKETVKIWSGFFRLGYRFGNRELPPTRDGAPPRGPL
jgi:hypothetical protein